MRPHIGHLRHYAGVFKEANSKLHWESKRFKSLTGNKNRNVINMSWAKRTQKQLKESYESTSKPKVIKVGKQKRQRPFRNFYLLINQIKAPPASS